MKIKEINLKPLLSELRTFTYTTVVNDTPATVNVEMFPSSQLDTMYKFFEDKWGNLRADDIAIAFKNGDITASNLADIIKTVNSQKWKHYLGIWNSEYNPLWNVDGVETRTIKTEYGKITTFGKGSNSTTEQLTGGETITEQLTDGESITEQLTDGTNTTAVTSFNSSGFDNKEKLTINNGKTKTTMDSGKTKTTIDNGKTKTTFGGEDTEENDGFDKVTDVYERHGNIGVTMSQQLLEAEESFWNKFDIFNKWFKDILTDITIPIYE